MMTVQKAGDRYLVTLGSAVFERVGEVALGECDGMRYEQVGELHKFIQTGRSCSLRSARVNLKKMRQESFA